LQIPGYLVVFGILLGCGLARATSSHKAVAAVPSRALRISIKDPR
jgi:hypothetical protein